MTTLEILALLNLPGYGPSTVRKIVDMIGDNNVSSAEDLLYWVNAYEGYKKKPSLKTIEDIEETLSFAGDIILLSEEFGIKTVSCIDEDFPQSLNNVLPQCEKDVPLVLYYRGDISITQRKSIAIIGTDKPTPEGIELSRYYGKLFSEAGYNVVSSLSIGCDSYALEGCLQGNGVGKPIALLDHGLDIISKNENTQLADEILAQGGLLISKFPVGEPSNRCSLLSTNRFQALFTDATVLIQSPSKGSTFYAGMEALKAHKPVFCVEYKDMEAKDKTQGNALLVSLGASYLDEDNPIEQVKKVISRMW